MYILRITSSYENPYAEGITSYENGKKCDEEYKWLPDILSAPLHPRIMKLIWNSSLLTC
jgi:hypothetical protein